MTSREHGRKRYHERNHPMNQLPKEVVENVERHLDMILRPDLAESDAKHVCRVYAPEVNTHEKLRRLVASRLRVDFDQILISPTPFRIMFLHYLKNRSCNKFNFATYDNNSSTMCKTFHLGYERKYLHEKLSPYTRMPRLISLEYQWRYDDFAHLLVNRLVLRKFCEEEAIRKLHEGSMRDARIRG